MTIDPETDTAEQVVADQQQDIFETDETDSGLADDQAHIDSVVARLRARPAVDEEDWEAAAPSSAQTIDEDEDEAAHEAAEADRSTDQAMDEQLSLEITDGETAHLQAEEQTVPDVDQDRGTDAFASTAADESAARADAVSPEPVLDAPDQEVGTDTVPAADLADEQDLREQMAQDQGEPADQVSDAEAEAQTSLGARQWLDTHAPEVSISAFASNAALRAAAEHYVDRASKTGDEIEVEQMYSVLVDERSFAQTAETDH